MDKMSKKWTQKQKESEHHFSLKFTIKKRQSKNSLRKLMGWMRKIGISIGKPNRRTEKALDNKTSA